MTLARVSVIIPTRNRSESLRQTIRCLRAQELTRSQYEIVVVDDGSTPPVSKSLNEELADCSLVRLEGVERSAARNRGAAVATGDVLLFVDDDMTVGADFLTAHLGAHKEWPEAIVVGAIRLPDESLATPLGRFRQNLEQRTTPPVRGLTSTRNFCTAANMSISRELFLGLGGFDVSLSSSEDQDLALRHTAGGGLIAFLPEAEAIHNDNALDIGSYCRRAEWGSENMIAFCQRHPHWPDNIERERINGPVIWGLEPIAQSARKLIKSLLAARLIIAIMLAAASVLERSAPRSGALDRIYRLLLGAHIFRGYRSGLRSVAKPNPGINAQKIGLIGGVLIGFGILATILITLPTRNTVYRMDDWDYIAEWNSLSFLKFVSRVNPDGQFNPVAKAIYGLFLSVFHYSNLPLALFNFVVGWASILIWFAILKRLNCWTTAGALAILAIRISYVGIVDVFWYPLQGATEIAFLLFTVAVYLLLGRRSLASIWACSAALVAGSLAFGNGVVPPFTLAAAFFLSAHRSPRVSGKRDGYAGAMLAVTVAAVVLCTLVPRFVQGRGAGVSFDLRGIANYFFWGGIINGAMSGVAPLLLPGVLHALFFMLLAAGTIWIATSTESRERKFVVLVLFLTQTGTSLLVALTRWQRGAAHASSYRYVYMNVFLQLPLVAILIGILSERMRRVHYASGFASWVWIRRAVLTAGALPFILGLSCSLQARSQVFALETERSQCVFRIVNNENSEECISSIYYRPDPDFVRRVWSVVKERPVELNGASLLQSPISRVTSTDSRK